MSTQTASPLAGVKKSADMAKLRTENVRMSFQRDGKAIPVLEDINLAVAEAEFICLLGPSGCG